MANIKVCNGCNRILLEEYDFNIRWRRDRCKYYYTSKCKRCLCKKSKQWHQNNKIKRTDYIRIHYQNNKQYYQEKNKQWAKDNLYKRKSINAKYRALKAGAEGSHTIKDLQYIYYHQSHKCPSCGKQISFEDMTVDHIVPLTWGGSNYPSNIQLLCLSCNSSKKNYHDTDYRDYIPLFLEE